MLRALLAAGLLAGCAGNQPAAHPAAPAEPAATPAPAQARPAEAEPSQAPPKSYLEVLERLRAAACECDSMECVHHAHEQIATTAAADKPSEEEESRASELERKLDACLSAIQTKELLHELDGLRAEMCGCSDAQCKEAVAKKAVRAAVVEQRFAEVQSSEEFRRSKRALDTCYGRTLFE